MADAVRFDRWNHTASLQCTLAEPHRDKWKHPDPFSPSEFHPMANVAPKVIPPPTPEQYLQRLIAKFGAVPFQKE